MSIRFLKLSLASPESIRSWTERVLPNGKRVGKILKGDLIDYKNGLPIRDGLSCERIFGPMVSFTCTCGRFKCIETRGIHIVHDTLRSSRPILPDISRQTSVFREKQFDKLESPFQSPTNLTGLETSMGNNPIVSQNTISKPTQKLVSNEKSIGSSPPGHNSLPKGGDKRGRIYENTFTDASRISNKKTFLNEPRKSPQGHIIPWIAYNQKKMIQFLSYFYYDYESIYHLNKNEMVPSFVSIFEEPYYITLKNRYVVDRVKPQTVYYPSKKRPISKSCHALDFFSLMKTRLMFKTRYPEGNSFSKIQNLVKPLSKFVLAIYTGFWFDLKIHYNNFVYEKHLIFSTSMRKNNTSKAYDNFGVHSSFLSKLKLRSLYDKSQKLPIISGILPRPANFFNFPSLPQFWISHRVAGFFTKTVKNNTLQTILPSSGFFIKTIETHKLHNNWYNIYILKDISYRESFFKGLNKISIYWSRRNQKIELSYIFQFSMELKFKKIKTEADQRKDTSFPAEPLTKNGIITLYFGRKMRHKNTINSIDQKSGIVPLVDLERKPLSDYLTRGIAFLAILKMALSTYSTSILPYKWKFWWIQKGNATSVDKTGDAWMALKKKKDSQSQVFQNRVPSLWSVSYRDFIFSDYISFDKKKSGHVAGKTFRQSEGGNHIKNTDGFSVGPKAGKKNKFFSTVFDKKLLKPVSIFDSFQKQENIPTGAGLHRKTVWFTSNHQSSSTTAYAFSHLDKKKPVLSSDFSWSQSPQIQNVSKDKTNMVPSDLTRMHREEASKPYAGSNTKQNIRVYKFKNFPPEEIRYCPYCEVELLPNSIRRYRLGYIEFVSPVTHIWYTASSIPLLLNLSKTMIEGIASCHEALSSGFPPVYKWSYNGESPTSWTFQMQPLKLPINGVPKITPINEILNGNIVKKSNLTEIIYSTIRPTRSALSENSSLQETIGNKVWIPSFQIIPHKITPSLQENPFIIYQKRLIWPSNEHSPLVDTKGKRGPYFLYRGCLDSLKNPFIQNAEINSKEKTLWPSIISSLETIPVDGSVEHLNRGVQKENSQSLHNHLNHFNQERVNMASRNLDRHYQVANILNIPSILNSNTNKNKTGYLKGNQFIQKKSATHWIIINDQQTKGLSLMLTKRQTWPFLFNQSISPFRKHLRSFFVKTKNERLLTGKSFKHTQHSFLSPQERLFLKPELASVFNISNEIMRELAFFNQIPKRVDSHYDLDTATDYEKKREWLKLEGFFEDPSNQKLPDNSQVDLEIDNQTREKGSSNQKNENDSESFDHLSLPLVLPFLGKNPDNIEFKSNYFNHENFHTDPLKFIIDLFSTEYIWDYTNLKSSTQPEYREDNSLNYNQYPNRFKFFQDPNSVLSIDKQQSNDTWNDLFISYNDFVTLWSNIYNIPGIFYTNRAVQKKTSGLRKNTFSLKKFEWELSLFNKNHYETEFWSSLNRFYINNDNWFSKTYPFLPVSYSNLPGNKFKDVLKWDTVRTPVFQQSGSMEIAKSLSKNNSLFLQEWYPNQIYSTLRRNDSDLTNFYENILSGSAPPKNCFRTLGRNQYYFKLEQMTRLENAFLKNLFFRNKFQKTAFFKRLGRKTSLLVFPVISTSNFHSKNDTNKIILETNQLSHHLTSIPFYKTRNATPVISSSNGLNGEITGGAWMALKPYQNFTIGKNTAFLFGFYLNVYRFNFFTPHLPRIKYPLFFLKKSGFFSSLIKHHFPIGVNFPAESTRKTKAIKILFSSLWSARTGLYKFTAWPILSKEEKGPSEKSLWPLRSNCVTSQTRSRQLYYNSPGEENYMGEFNKFSSGGFLNPFSQKGGGGLNLKEFYGENLFYKKGKQENRIVPKNNYQELDLNRFDRALYENIHSLQLYSKNIFQNTFIRSSFNKLNDEQITQHLKNEQNPLQNLGRCEIKLEWPYKKYFKNLQKNWLPILDELKISQDIVNLETTCLLKNKRFNQNLFFINQKWFEENLRRGDKKTLPRNKFFFRSRHTVNFQRKAKKQEFISVGVPVSIIYDFIFSHSSSLIKNTLSLEVKPMKNKNQWLKTLKIRPYGGIKKRLVSHSIRGMTLKKWTKNQHVLNHYLNNDLNSKARLYERLKTRFKNHYKTIPSSFLWHNSSQITNGKVQAQILSRRADFNFFGTFKAANFFSRRRTSKGKINSIRELVHQFQNYHLPGYDVNYRFLLYKKGWARVFLKHGRGHVFGKIRDLVDGQWFSLSPFSKNESTLNDLYSRQVEFSAPIFPVQGKTLPKDPTAVFDEEKKRQIFINTRLKQVISKKHEYGFKLQPALKQIVSKITHQKSATRSLNREVKGVKQRLEPLALLGFDTTKIEFFGSLKIYAKRKFLEIWHFKNQKSRNNISLLFNRLKPLNPSSKYINEIAGRPRPKTSLNHCVATFLGTLEHESSFSKQTVNFHQTKQKSPQRRILPWKKQFLSKNMILTRKKKPISHLIINALSLNNSYYLNRFRLTRLMVEPEIVENLNRLTMNHYKNMICYSYAIETINKTIGAVVLLNSTIPSKSIKNVQYESSSSYSMTSGLVFSNKMCQTIEWNPKLLQERNHIQSLSLKTSCFSYFGYGPIASLNLGNKSSQRRIQTKSSQGQYQQRVILQKIPKQIPLLGSFPQAAFFWKTNVERLIVKTPILGFLSARSKPRLKKREQINLFQSNLSLNPQIIDSQTFLASSSIQILKWGERGHIFAELKSSFDTSHNSVNAVSNQFKNPKHDAIKNYVNPSPNKKTNPISVSHFKNSSQGGLFLPFKSGYPENNSNRFPTLKPTLEEFKNSTAWQQTGNTNYYGCISQITSWGSDHGSWILFLKYIRANIYKGDQLLSSYFNKMNFQMMPRTGSIMLQQLLSQLVLIPKPLNQNLEAKPFSKDQSVSEIDTWQNFETNGNKNNYTNRNKSIHQNDHDIVIRDQSHHDFHYDSNFFSKSFIARESVKKRRARLHSVVNKKPSFGSISSENCNISTVNKSFQATLSYESFPDKWSSIYYQTFSIIDGFIFFQKRLQKTIQKEGPAGKLNYSRIQKLDQRINLPKFIKRFKSKLSNPHQLFLNSATPWNMINLKNDALQGWNGDSVYHHKTRFTKRFSNDTIGSQTCSKLVNTYVLSAYKIKKPIAYKRFKQCYQLYSCKRDTAKAIINNWYRLNNFFSYSQNTINHIQSHAWKYKYSSMNESVYTLPVRSKKISGFIQWGGSNHSFSDPSMLFSIPSVYNDIRILKLLYSLIVSFQPPRGKLFNTLSHSTISYASSKTINDYATYKISNTYYHIYSVNSCLKGLKPYFKKSFPKDAKQITKNSNHNPRCGGLKHRIWYSKSPFLDTLASRVYPAGGSKHETRPPCGQIRMKDAKEHFMINNTTGLNNYHHSLVQNLVWLRYYLLKSKNMSETVKLSSSKTLKKNNLSFRLPNRERKQNTTNGVFKPSSHENRVENFYFSNQKIKIYNVLISPLEISKFWSSNGIFNSGFPTRSLLPGGAELQSNPDLLKLSQNSPKSFQSPLFNTKALPSVYNDSTPWNDKWWRWSYVTPINNVISDIKPYSYNISNFSSAKENESMNLYPYGENFYGSVHTDNPLRTRKNKSVTRWNFQNPQSESDSILQSCGNFQTYKGQVESETLFIKLKEIGNYNVLMKKKNTLFKTVILKMNSSLRPLSFGTNLNQIQLTKTIKLGRKTHPGRGISLCRVAAKTKRIPSDNWNYHSIFEKEKLDRIKTNISPLSSNESHAWKYIFPSMDEPVYTLPVRSKFISINRLEFFKTWLFLDFAHYSHFSPSNTCFQPVTDGFNNLQNQYGVYSTRVTQKYLLPDTGHIREFNNRPCESSFSVKQWFLQLYEYRKNFLLKKIFKQRIYLTQSSIEQFSILPQARVGFLTKLKFRPDKEKTIQDKLHTHLFIESSHEKTTPKNLAVTWPEEEKTRMFVNTGFDILLKRRINTFYNQDRNLNMKYEFKPFGPQIKHDSTYSNWKNSMAGRNFKPQFFHLNKNLFESFKNLTRFRLLTVPQILDLHDQNNVLNKMQKNKIPINLFGPLMFSSSTKPFKKIITFPASRVYPTGADKHETGPPLNSFRDGSSGGIFFSGVPTGPSFLKKKRRGPLKKDALKASEKQFFWGTPTPFDHKKFSLNSRGLRNIYDPNFLVEPFNFNKSELNENFNNNSIQALNEHTPIYDETYLNPNRPLSSETLFREENPLLRRVSSSYKALLQKAKILEDYPVPDPNPVDSKSIYLRLLNGGLPHLIGGNLQNRVLGNRLPLFKRFVSHYKPKMRTYFDTNKTTKSSYAATPLQSKQEMHPPDGFVGNANGINWGKPKNSNNKSYDLKSPLIWDGNHKIFKNWIDRERRLNDPSQIRKTTSKDVFSIRDQTKLSALRRVEGSLENETMTNINDGTSLFFNEKSQNTNKNGVTSPVSVSKTKPKSGSVLKNSPQGRILRTDQSIAFRKKNTSLVGNSPRAGSTSRNSTFNYARNLRKLRLQYLRNFRRLRFIEYLKATYIKPEWMILSLLPVLPPDLRPVIANPRGYITGDINTHYQNVIYRNNNIEKLLDTFWIPRKFYSKIAFSNHQKATILMLSSIKSYFYFMNYLPPEGSKKKPVELENRYSISKLFSKLTRFPLTPLYKNPFKNIEAKIVNWKLERLISPMFYKFKPAYREHTSFSAGPTRREDLKRLPVDLLDSNNKMSSYNKMFFSKPSRFNKIGGFFISERLVKQSTAWRTRFKSRLIETTRPANKIKWDRLKTPIRTEKTSRMLGNIYFQAWTNRFILYRFGLKNVLTVNNEPWQWQGGFIKNQPELKNDSFVIKKRKWFKFDKNNWFDNSERWAITQDFQKPKKSACLNLPELILSNRFYKPVLKLYYQKGFFGSNIGIATGYNKIVQALNFPLLQHDWTFDKNLGISIKDNPVPSLEKNIIRTQALHDSKPLQEMQYSLQKAVDALIDNSQKLQSNVLLRKGRPLKSLSDNLKGKEGRFRQHLLGKRVDYSGRSVIVVGPDLKLYECGIPLIMALRLFQPFLILYLIYRFKIASLLATQLIQRKHPMVINLLKKFIETWPILLNRAPTLHRMNIQAFKIRLVQGKAILLHPLVCSSYNADFDGDQMGVHVPITQQARAESWKLLWSINNSIGISSRQPLFLPSQDMVIGNYYLTAPPIDWSLTPEFLNLAEADIKNETSRFKFSDFGFHPIASPGVKRQAEPDRFKNPSLSPAGAELIKYSSFSQQLRFQKINHYFFSLEEAYQYYLNRVYRFHINTPVWFRFPTTFETSERVKPIEITIDKYGNTIYTTKYYEKTLKRNRILGKNAFYFSNYLDSQIIYQDNPGTLVSKPYHAIDFKHPQKRMFENSIQRVVANFNLSRPRRETLVFSKDIEKTKTPTKTLFNGLSLYSKPNNTNKTIIVSSQIIFNKNLSPIVLNQIIRSTFGRIEFYYEAFYVSRS